MPGGSAQNEQGGPQRPAPDSRISGSRSGVEHGDDLKGSRIYHHDLVADEEKLITSPIRIVRHDFGRKRMEADVAGNAGANRDREVDVGHRRHVLIADHGRDLGALFGRELGSSARLSDGLRTFFLFRAGSGAVFAAFSLLVGVTLLAFGLHVLTATLIAALGFHVLAGGALFILRVHALGSLAWAVFLSRFLAGRFFTHRTSFAAGLHGWLRQTTVKRQAPTVRSAAFRCHRRLHLRDRRPCLAHWQDLFPRSTPRSLR